MSVYDTRLLLSAYGFDVAVNDSMAVQIRQTSSDLNDLRQDVRHCSFRCNGSSPDSAYQHWDAFREILLRCRS